jgi:Fe-S cluster biosynthesis and repair protein YggX
MDEGKALFFVLRIFRSSWSTEWKKKLTFIIREEEVNVCDVKSLKGCVKNMISLISEHLLNSMWERIFLGGRSGKSHHSAGAGAGAGLVCKKFSKS